MFKPNDIDEIYYRYFDQIWQRREAYADPSGWTDTWSNSADLVPDVSVPASALGRYYLDEGTNLGSAKEAITGLISLWESRELDMDELTLYSSVSTATIAVLVALKEKAVRHVFFETPAYSVTVNQAVELGLTPHLLPSYYSSEFQISHHYLDQFRKRSPFAVWLTQPRVSLGIDQVVQNVQDLLGSLTTHDYLVIDEATEQYFPSLLSRLGTRAPTCTIIRIRGLLKGAGLNAIRLAIVIHPQEFRTCLEDVQSVLGSSLDAWSLEMGVALAEQPNQLKTILAVASDQAKSLRNLLAKLTTGSTMEPSRLVNGYMGVLFVKLADSANDFEVARNRMLQFLRHRKIPVILGPTMLFAFNPPWEQIRLNYFNRQHHLIRLVEELLVFFDGRLHEVD